MLNIRHITNFPWGKLAAAVLCSLLVVFLVPQRLDRSVKTANEASAQENCEYTISVSSQMPALSQQAQNAGVNFVQQARAVGGSASINLLAKIRGYSIIRERLLAMDFKSAPQNVFELPGFNFSPNKRYFVFTLREIII
ncbi:MAG: hypothetical protein ACD_77C00029G0001 [uncultured bacterium]|nr:MAG: hypothetical protein ACD_77C00029G0001 [uncultured bacterium]